VLSVWSKPTLKRDASPQTPAIQTRVGMDVYGHGQQFTDPALAGLAFYLTTKVVVDVPASAPSASVAATVTVTTTPWRSFAEGR